MRELSQSGREKRREELLKSSAIEVIFVQQSQVGLLSYEHVAERKSIKIFFFAQIAEKIMR